MLYIAYFILINLSPSYQYVVITSMKPYLLFVHENSTAKDLTSVILQFRSLCTFLLFLINQVCIKGTGSPYKLKVYYLYHNSGHCTHNPVNSKEIASLYGKKKMAVLLIGRAKRAPHWGVQSRFRVIYIYIYIYMSVCLSWSKKA